MNFRSLPNALPISLAIPTRRASCLRHCCGLPRRCRSVQTAASRRHPRVWPAATPTAALPAAAPSSRRPAAEARGPHSRRLLWQPRHRRISTHRCSRGLSRTRPCRRQHTCSIRRSTMRQPWHTCLRHLQPRVMWGSFPWHHRRCGNPTDTTTCTTGPRSGPSHRRRHHKPKWCRRGHRSSPGRCVWKRKK